MQTLICLFAAGIALAADAPAPTINAELRAKYWRAAAEQISAAAQLERAQTALRVAQEALTKACGESHDPVIGPDGEPKCEVKPKPEAKPAK